MNEDWSWESVLFQGKLSINIDGNDFSNGNNNYNDNNDINKNNSSNSNNIYNNNIYNNNSTNNNKIKRSKYVPLARVSDEGTYHVYCASQKLFGAPITFFNL